MRGRLALPILVIVSAASLTAAALGCSSDRATTVSPDAGTDVDDASPDAVARPPADASPSDAAGPDPTCSVAGCMRRAGKIGDFPRGDIEPLLDPRVTIENGYSIWTVEYVTGDRTSLATLAIPFGIAPPALGYAVVANNHGTTGLEDPCGISGTVFGAGLAGLFGARGMIGVATDYPGLGTSGIHPYLVFDVEGKAVLDAMRATRAFAKWKSIPISGRYAAAGMSQGGHATLAAATLHATYAPDLDIRAFAAAAPASVFEEQWRAGIGFDGAHVPYHAMMVHAWTQHYGYAGPSPWAQGKEASIVEALTKRCIFAMNSAGAIGDVLGPERSSIFSPAFLDAYATGNWGAYSAFTGWFAENRVKPYKQTAPLKIYQGDADAVVPEAGTAEMVAALRAGGDTVEYEVVPGGTHIDVAYGYVASFELRTAASIAWLRARVDVP